MNGVTSGPKELDHGRWQAGAGWNPACRDGFT